MSLDPFGREIDTSNLASEMLKPLSAANKNVSAKLGGFNKEIDKLNSIINQLKSSLGSVVDSNDEIRSKISDLTQVVEENLKAADKINKTMQAGSPRAKVSKNSVDKKTFEESFKEAIKPSKELKDLTKTITSKHTVYVKDVNVFRGINALNLNVKELTAAVQNVKFDSEKALGQIASQYKKVKKNAAFESMVSKDEHPGLGGSGDSLNKSLANLMGDKAVGFEDIAKDAKETADGLTATEKATKGTKKATDDVTKGFNRYLRSLGYSKSYLHEQIKNYHDINKLTEDEVTTLRKSLYYAHEYSKSEQERKKRLETYITEAKTQDQLNKAFKKYVDFLDTANKKAVQHVETWSLIKQNTDIAIDRLGRISTTIGAISGGGNLADQMFGNAVKDAFEWNQSLKQSSFIQSEILDNTATLVEYQNTVSLTGQKLDKFYKSYAKNLSKGIKDYKANITLSEKGLKLATQIEASAEGSADFARVMHQELNFNVSQIGLLTSQIRNVGSITGVFKDDLLEAANSAAKMAENMRDAGNSSKDAMKSLTAMEASGKKFGVSEPIKHIEELLTGGNAKFTQALTSGDKTAQLLLRAASATGNTNALMAGSLPEDPEALKATWNKVEELFNKDITVLFKQLGVSSHDELNQSIRKQKIELEKMDKSDPRYNKALEKFKNFQNTANEVKRAADSIAKEYSDFGVGKFSQVNKAMKESLKTPEEQLSELQNKMDSQTATSMEKANFAQQIASLNFDKYERHLEFAEGKEKEDLIRKMANEANKARDAAISGGKVNKNNIGEIIDESMIKDAVLGNTGKIRESLEKTQIEQQKVQDPMSQQQRNILQQNEIASKSIGNKMVSVADIAAKMYLLDIMTTSLGWIEKSVALIAASYVIKDGISLFRWMRGGGIGRSVEFMKNIPQAISSKVSGLGKGAEVASDVAKVGGKTSKISKAFGFIDDLAKLGSETKLLQGMKLAGNAFVALGAAYAAYDGYTDTETQKQLGIGAGSNAALSAFTGGSSVNSASGNLFGLQKGGNTDKTLSIGESALYGAGLGAAVGGPIGAAAGAIIASGLQGAKIILAESGEKLEAAYRDGNAAIADVNKQLGNIDYSQEERNNFQLQSEADRSQGEAIMNALKSGNKSGASNNLNSLLSNAVASKDNFSGAMTQDRNDWSDVIAKAEAVKDKFGLDTKSQGLLDQLKGKQELYNIEQSIREKMQSENFAGLNKMGDLTDPVQKQDYLVKEKLFQEELAKQMSARANQASISTASTQIVSTDTKLPTSATDIENKLRQDRAAVNENPAQQSIAQDTASVEENTRKTNSEIEKLNTLMSELVSYFRNSPKGNINIPNSLAGGDPRQKDINFPPANYHTIPLDRFSGLPARGVQELVQA